DQSQRAPISAAAISLKLAHLIPKICRTTRSAPARCAPIGCLRSPHLVTVRGVIFRVPPVRVPAPEFLIYVSKIIGIPGPPVRHVFSPGFAVLLIPCGLLRALARVALRPVAVRPSAILAMLR